jgi:hypothetical protein
MKFFDGSCTDKRKNNIGKIKTESQKDKNLAGKK